MIVIHHKGDAEKLFRGSSAIQNQCDATVTNAILAALPSQTKQEVADKIGRREDDPTFRAAWKGLRDTERLSKKKGWWSDSLEKTTTTPLRVEEDDDE